MTEQSPAALPLAGLIALDLTDEVTVFGARLLADLGARVIRVEARRGDAIRRREPFLGGKEGLERSLAHLLYNGGKESVALDLDNPESWMLVERMLPAVDVVIAPLQGTAPCQAFLQRGRDGAWPERPPVVDVVFRREAPGEVATDLVATAAGGLLVLNGHSDDPPNYPAGELAYKEAALAAAEAALALVLDRERTGESGWVTVSLQEGVSTTTVQTANSNIWFWRGRAPSRHTPVSSGTTFKCRDGKWASFTIHPPNWSRFADWVRDMPGAESFADPEWEDLTFRATRGSEVAVVVERLCASLTRQELLDEGQRRGLLALPVNSPREIAEDPHLVARGFLHELEHSQLGQRVTLPRSAFLSPSWETKPQPAPALGASTGEVLRGLAGCSEKEIASLFEAGIAFGERDTTSTPAERTQRRARIAAPRPATPPRQPLAGIRIADFCWAAAGPLTTRLLANLGADVIKIESEYRLDPLRYIGPQPDGMHSLNTNGVFNDCNVNKRAVTLNLNTERGRELAREIVRTADMVTSNYTPDRMDKWGFGYDDLRALRPDIIALNLAVMGTSGPHKDWRSYGSGIVAMCGLAERTGFPGRAPIGLGTLHTDFTVPYFAALYAMAALYRRDRTGEGAFLELSQYEASVHLLDTEIVDLLANGAEPERMGNRHPRMAPHGVYPAAGEDRWLAVACRDGEDFARLARVIGRPDWATDAGLASIEGRRANEDAIDAAISAWSAGLDRWEAARQLQAAGVPASAAEDLEDLATRDPGMMDFYLPLQLTEETLGHVQHDPILWDGHRLPMRRAPHWNEHTLPFLQEELGVADEEIGELLDRQVIF